MTRATFFRLLLGLAPAALAPSPAAQAQGTPGDLDLRSIPRRAQQAVQPQAPPDPAGQPPGPAMSMPEGPPVPFGPPSYIGKFGAFDLDPAGPSAMLILLERPPGPFLPTRQKFFKVTLNYYTGGYRDPRTGITGDIYSARLDDGKDRYFLMGDREYPGGQRYVVFYNPEGKMTYFTLADTGQR